MDSIDSMSIAVISKCEIAEPNGNFGL